MAHNPVTAVARHVRLLTSTPKTPQFPGLLMRNGNMMRKRSTRNAATRQRGALTIELVLGLPIVLMVMLAVVEFGLLLMASQAVSSAANQGAREASLPGATVEGTAAVVHRSLGSWRFSSAIEPVVVEPASLEQTRTGDLVSVTVAVDSSRAAPNLLKMFGIDLAGRRLSSTYVYRKE